MFRKRWFWIAVVVLLIGGIQLLSLGIVGQYIARIFEEVKGRPLYVVGEVVEGGAEAPSPEADPALTARREEP